MNLLEARRFLFYLPVSFSILPSLLWNHLAGRTLPYLFFLLAILLELSLLFFLQFKKRAGRHSMVRWQIVVLVLVSLPVTVYSTLFLVAGPLRLLLSLLYLLFFFRLSTSYYYISLYFAGLLLLLILAAQNYYAGNDAFRTSVVSFTIVAIVILFARPVIRMRQKLISLSVASARKEHTIRRLQEKSANQRRLLMPYSVRTGRHFVMDLIPLGLYESKRSLGEPAFDRYWTNYRASVQELLLADSFECILSSDFIRGVIPVKDGCSGIDYSDLLRRMIETHTRTVDSTQARGNRFWRLVIFLYESDLSVSMDHRTEQQIALFDPDTGLSRWNLLQQQHSDLPLVFHYHPGSGWTERSDFH